MPFEGMSQQAPQPANGMEMAQQKFGVDLSDDKAVRAKMIAMQQDTPKLLELLNLWNDHQKNEQTN